MTVPTPNAAPAVRIKPDALTEGKTILVDGVIGYNRVSSHIEGEELARYVARERQFAAQRGKATYPVEVPHTTVTLIDAKVRFADPNNPTLEELYINQSVYTASQGANAGKTTYQIRDRSPQLPTVFAPTVDENGNSIYAQVTHLEGDFASGIPVTLVIGTYQAGQYANKGVGINQIVLHEAPRYYSPAGAIPENVLSALGIKIADGPIKPTTGVAYRGENEQATDATTPATPTVPAGSVVTSDGFALPGPTAGVPQAAPAQPAQAVQPTAPVFQPPAPPVAAPVAQAPAPQAQAQPQPAPTANPLAGMTLEQQQVLMQQILAAQGNQQAGGSAFTNPAPAAPTAQTDDPWGPPPGIGFGN